MRNIGEVLRLKAEGMNNSDIARSTGIGRTSVYEYLSRAKIALLLEPDVGGLAVDGHGLGERLEERDAVVRELDVLGTENRRRTPPDTLGVEATVYLGSRSTTTTPTLGCMWRRKYATATPIAPPPMIATSVLIREASSAKPRSDQGRSAMVAQSPMVRSRQRASRSAGDCRTVTAWPIRFA